jgi:hypothetical protein
MSNESNIFSKPLVWSSVFENVFRNVFAMNRSAYSVLGFEPGLVLDFDDEYYRLGEFQRQFADAITHTRASTATYVDSTGTLQTAAINEPRVGHHVWNGSAWVNEGLLHESEARTNYFTYSSDFSNAVWTLDADTRTASSGAFGLTSYLIEETSATHAGVFASVALTAVPWTVWVIAKSGTSNILRLRYGGATGRNADFNLSDGTVTSVNAASKAGTISFGNGFYLCWHTTTPVAGATNTSINTVSGSVELVAAQAEIGPTPSSYIPTSGSTVTRSADVLTIPAANLPWPTVAPLALSIQMDGRVTYADTGSFGAVFFYRWISGSNQIYARVNDGGVRVGYIDAVVIADGVTDISTSGVDVTSPNSPQSVSIAARHGSTFVQVAANGVSYAADNTPTVLPDLSAANLLLATTYNGTIRTFRMWAQDIGDAGLVEATT